MDGAVHTGWKTRLTQLRDAESYAHVASGVSLAEYDTLADDAPPCELIEGELFVSPAPYWGHQGAQAELFGRLWRHVTKHGLGQVLVAPTGVRLGRDSEVQPDILYIPKTHHAYRKDVAYATEPPELVVEIVSPGSIKHDRERKFVHYAKHGVPHYWIVDPIARSMEAFVLKGSAYALEVKATGSDTFAAPPFPELVIPLADVFVVSDE